MLPPEGCTSCRSVSVSPPEVWWGRTLEEVKVLELDHHILSPEIYSAASGPDIGIDYVKTLKTGSKDTSTEDFDENNTQKNDIMWGSTNRKAYGMSVSLYDRNPVTGKVSGDPMADCYAYISRKNNALLVIADGVNWGEKSKMAARCAVNEAVNFIHDHIFVDSNLPHNTKEALDLMRRAFDQAQLAIIKNNGGLTTLNITMILPIKNCFHYAVCSVNVGDSLTFVFSKRCGMNELSIGSHDITLERDMRDAGGALGPVNGNSPYLVNLTFSVTTCEPGDIVFLTTDGVSDNFDPVVTKVAVPGKKDSLLCAIDKKAEMLPHERHWLLMKGMELVIHEYELETENDISAQELCTALIDHITKLTNPKRLVIENPSLYTKQYSKVERYKIEESIRKSLKALPGKLDHATVIAYEAGLYRDETTPNTSYDQLSALTSTSSLDRCSVSSNMERTNSSFFESNV